jgi:caa(3)-type oxidase subunit IV
MNAPDHAHAGDAPDVHELDHHLRDYWRIIITLAVATAVEFGISGLMGSHHLGFAMGVVVLLVIAFFKAILVARFFMHLKYDPKPLALIAMTPLLLSSFILIIGSFDACQGPNI